jgi:hypothetical protein
MKTVYDLIRHRATLEVICKNCDNSRIFNHRFLMSQFGGGQILAALKFVCRCGAQRYRLRIDEPFLHGLREFPKDQGLQQAQDPGGVRLR